MMPIASYQVDFFPGGNGASGVSGWGKRVLLGLLITGAAAAISLIMIESDGNLLAGIAFVAVLASLAITLYRLDYGFYLFIGAVLLFDQFDIPGYEPPTFKIAYFRNLKEIPYLPSFSAGVVNPLELHLLFLVFVWLFVFSVRKDLQLRKAPVWGAALLLLGGMVSSLVMGLAKGGELLVAFWEVRALFYLAILYFFVPQIIQTKEQIRAFLWVCISAITIKAVQGIIRYASLGFSLSGIQTLTNHEDPLFFLSLIMFLFGLTLFNARDSQRRVLIFLLLPLMMGFFVAQRRAVYAAIAPAFAIFVALLSPKRRVMLFKTAVPVIGFLVIYGAIFWDSDSKWGAPVRLVKSGLSTDPETSGEHYYSNLYREIEKMDLAVTIKKSPVFGIGYGNKYEMPLPLVKIAFPLRDYIPHDQILWVMVKTGAVGFGFFWFFFDCVAFRAASFFPKLDDPYLKSVLALIVIMIGAQMVVSYYDMQLTYYRNMVYLGTLMGLFPAIESIQTRRNGKPETPVPDPFMEKT